MTWQAGSMALVVAALAGGFIWYERRRPSSKLVALVAALAALAVAGRVLFAAIPNVQATTDVVFLSGCALGAGPGFAVGAVGALVSNFFLGQGPWTSWQMLGWAAVGVGGAALGRIAGRDPGRALLGRWPLAFVCALAGLAFGAWMDLFTLVTFTAERSVDSYLAVSAAGLPFNIAHALGNGLLCLLLGPGFLRLLLRFRLRFEIDWKPLAPAFPRRGAGAGTPIAAVVLLALSVAASPQPARAAGVAGGLRYLERAQNQDGGFGGAPGQRSSGLMSGWAALGLEAAGRNPRDVRHAGRSVIDFMRRSGRELTDLGEVERTMLVLRGAGLSTRSFAGRRLLGRLLASQRRDGSFRGQVNLTTFGVLALRASSRHANTSPIKAAAVWLVRQQNRDGGFSFSRRGGASDVDDTGAALQALAAADRRRGRPVDRALAFLRREQNADGGLGQLAGSRSNAQSTAWAIQGLAAAGVDPRRFGRRPRSPFRYLGSLQQSDGSFRYSRTSAQTPVWVTAQSIIALRRKPFPLEPVPRSADRLPVPAHRPGHFPRAAQTALGRTRPAHRMGLSTPAQRPRRFPRSAQTALGSARPVSRDRQAPAAGSPASVGRDKGTPVAWIAGAGALLALLLLPLARRR